MSFLAKALRVGHAEFMSAQPAADLAPIPSAPVVDLDVDREPDEEEWERRVMHLASERIQSARTRFERLGIVDANGVLVSEVLPPDMASDSDTTLETG
jgi:hypothetical protein